MLSGLVGTTPPSLETPFPPRWHGRCRGGRWRTVPGRRSDAPRYGRSQGLGLSRGWTTGLARSLPSAGGGGQSPDDDLTRRGTGEARVRGLSRGWTTGLARSLPSAGGGGQSPDDDLTRRGTGEARVWGLSRGWTTGLARSLPNAGGGGLVQIIE